MEWRKEDGQPGARKDDGVEMEEMKGLNKETFEIKQQMIRWPAQWGHRPTIKEMFELGTLFCLMLSLFFVKFPSKCV